MAQKRTNLMVQKTYKNWKDYETEFGSLAGELWYGLHASHC